MSNNEYYDYVKMEDSKEIPDTVELNNSGVDKCLKGDFQGGISDFTNALEKTPENPIILANRSKAHEDAAIIDMLASFGFTFTGISGEFYQQFKSFKQRISLLIT